MTINIRRFFATTVPLADLIFLQVIAITDITRRGFEKPGLAPSDLNGRQASFLKSINM